MSGGIVRLLLYQRRMAVDGGKVGRYLPFVKCGFLIGQQQLHRQ
ncbi:hypothetical protein Barb7_02200 [Bacteroidales bacterium Barb7]|nr:hypothetical protein Barb7_02200 [Bacteroidales bacterium Barb7]